MKQDDLFQGAVVLARPRRDKDKGRKRSRCTVVRSFASGISTLTNEAGHLIIADNEDIRSAKITRNALVGLGFNWDASICQGRNKICNQYKYAIDDEREVRITLKKDCDLWGSNVIFWRGCYRGVQKVSCIHEVQRIINQQK